MASRNKRGPRSRAGGTNQPSEKQPEDLPTYRLPWPLAATAAILWSGFVLFNYYGVFPFPVEAISRVLGGVLGALPSLTAVLLWDRLTTFLWAGVLFLSAGSLGRFALMSATFPDGNRRERFVLETALGCGLLSYLMFLLAAVGGLYAWVVRPLIIGLGLWQAGRIVMDWRSAPPYSKPSNPFLRWPLLDKFAFALFLLQALHGLLGAFTPLVFFDSLAYHLGVPWLNVMAHRLVEAPWNVYAHMPMTVPYFYTAGLLVKDEMVSKLQCYGLGLLCCASIFSFCRRALTPRVGRWAAMIFYSLFHVLYISSACGTDLGITLFSMLAFYSFAFWWKDAVGPERGFPWSWIVLSGVFCGFAMGSKYTAVFVPVSLMAMLVYAGARKTLTWRQVFLAGGTLVAAGTVVLSPWLIKNVLFKGNPVFPFLSGLFPGTRADDPVRLHGLFTEASQYDVKGLAGFLLLPWDVTMGLKANAAVFTPVYLVFLPLLVFFKKYPVPLRVAAGASVLFALSWACTTTLARYLMPSLPFFAIAAAYGILKVPWPSVLKSFFRLSVLVMCLGDVSQSFLLTDQMEGWRPVIGLETKEEYLGRFHTTYPSPSFSAYDEINKELSPGARVLILGESRGFYLRRDHIASSVFNESPLIAWARESRDGDALADRLRREGITNMVLNLGESERLKGYGMLKFDEAGAAVLRQYWSRYVEELFHRDEMYGGRPVNRVLVYELLSPDAAAKPHPVPVNYLSDSVAGSAS